MHDALGDRMKTNYEYINRTFLIRRMPVVIRLDGKAFHTLTRNLNRPWDDDFIACMKNTAIKLCNEVQNVKLAYVQSDEISLLLTDYAELETQQWFGGNIQKMVSVSASIAAVEFTKEFAELCAERNWPAEVGYFDSRVFNIPKEEVCNYFIWRQNDATRNSIQALAQANFSHKELNGLGLKELQEKLFQEKGINWSDSEKWHKRGLCIKKAARDMDNVTRHFWETEWVIPEFTKDRNFIEELI